MAGERSNIKPLPPTLKRWRASIRQNDSNMDDATTNDKLSTLEAQVYDLNKALESVQQELSQLKNFKRKSEMSSGPEVEHRNVRAKYNDASSGDDHHAVRPSSEHTTNKPALSNTVGQNQSASTRAASVELGIPSLIVKLPLPSRIIKKARKESKKLFLQKFVPQAHGWSYHKEICCLAYHAPKKRFYWLRCPECGKSKTTDKKWIKGIYGVRGHCVNDPDCKEFDHGIEAIIAGSERLSRALAMNYADDPLEYS